MYFTTIICSPVFGKYIESIGSRNLFLVGTLIAGLGNIAFGLLEWIEDTNMFLALSLTVRIVSAMGETAFFTAIYPLAVDVSAMPPGLCVLAINPNLSVPLLNLRMYLGCQRAAPF